MTAEYEYEILYAGIWMPIKDAAVDFYGYLVFRLPNGQVAAIEPAKYRLRKEAP